MSFRGLGISVQAGICNCVTCCGLLISVKLWEQLQFAEPGAGHAQALHKLFFTIVSSEEWLDRLDALAQQHAYIYNFVQCGPLRVSDDQDCNSLHRLHRVR